MSLAYLPVDPDAVPARLTELIGARRPEHGALRVAIDGAPSAGGAQLAAALVDPLRAAGREAVPIAGDTFWRDASLRLEYGHEDVESYLSWLDAAALRREVLAAAGPQGSGCYLPSLRDPVTNRATRAPARVVTSSTVLLVHGQFLLGLDLPFDLTVHLAQTAAARARRVDPAQAWTLPAYDQYERQTRPLERADVVLRVDDPEHPAIRLRNRGSAPGT